MFAKIFKTVLSLGLFVTAIFQAAQIRAQNCATAPIGLVSAYSGDGSALDARSRNNGTIQGNVVYAAGKVGQALQFGGTGDTNGSGDRVNIGNPVNLQLQDFTIEGWIKRSSASVVTNSPAAGSAGGTFFAYGQSGYGFIIDQNTNALGLTNIGVSVVLSTATITDTNWHHVAVTKSSNQVIFYVDGAASAPVTYNPTFSFTANAAIGARGDSDVRNAFFGAIDELAIYNRPLSATEVLSIYNSGATGKCKPIAANAPDNQVLWLAGDGSATDASGNGNNGTLQGSASYAVGKVGQSFRFDGVGSAVTTAPNVLNQSFGVLSIETWVNPSQHGADSSGQLGKTVVSNTEDDGFALRLLNGVVQADFRLSGGNVLRTFGSALPLNAWSHVAVTYDGANIRAFVNGIQIGGNFPASGTIRNTANNGVCLMVGSEPAAPCIIDPNGFQFAGAIDELSVYNRALTADEIASIANAGLAGKYKVQSTVPSGLGAWYPGDGNANDLQAANNGTLQGGAAYAAGKVGQAFALNGTDAFVQIPSSAANDPTTAGSLEAWVKFNQTPSAAGHVMEVIGKGGNGSDFDLQAETDNRFKFYVGGSQFAGSNTVIQANVWYHVVGAWDSTVGLKIYVNGVLENTNAALTERSPSGQPLQIGNQPFFGPRLFNGLIDEPSVYNRMLTAAEINGIYNAQSGGKYKGAANPAVSNKAKTGDVELTFANTTAAGAVQETPLDAAKLPALPTASTSTGLYYDIAASATFTGNVTECFNLPLTGNAFGTMANFNNLKILHLEAGVWQDRTTSADFATKTLCGRTTTLSPFAIVQNSQPTAAAVSISGKVTANGRGLASARVELTGTNGKPVTVVTNSFGNFTFREVEAGATYIVNVSAKRYTFAPQVVSVKDSLSGLQFYAIQ